MVWLCRSAAAQDTCSNGACGMLRSAWGRARTRKFTRSEGQRKRRGAIRNQTLAGLLAQRRGERRRLGRARLVPT